MIWNFGFGILSIWDLGYRIWNFFEIKQTLSIDFFELILCVLVFA